MFREVSSNLRFHLNGYISNFTAVMVTKKKEAFLLVGFGQFSDIKETEESSLPDSFVELTVTTAAPTGPMSAQEASGAFTAGLDVEQNVVVGVQVSV